MKTGTLDLSNADQENMAAFLRGEEVSVRKLVPAETDDAISKLAREIARRALANLEEKGLQTLFVAMGKATWPATDGGRPTEAPILLVPASLETKGHGSKNFYLKRSGTVQPNLVLLHVLENQFGAKLSADELLTKLLGDDEGEQFDVRPVYADIMQKCTSIPGLEIKEFSALGNFAFQKMAMVKDLQERTQELANHDIISAIAGQPQFTYSYNAIQLLSITQGTQSVQFNYDPAGRLSTVTAPNGLVKSYGYDIGSLLRSISYSVNQVPVGTLSYLYDALNRRTTVNGTLAATMLPAAMPSATYDAANQVATWNGTAFAYDANGSLLNDGQNSYSWNARGQLAGITGVVNAAFAYDAVGRRTARSVGASSLNFVYDSSGIAQELIGGAVTASIWGGGGDGFIQRTDANGTVAPLTDALGTVIALADSNGNLVTQYFYDPFGGTSMLGAASGNPFQYIGRENDPTGLYYMHARYYSPALGRFISEDPLGFGGGDVNLHAYSVGSPTNLKDPDGSNPFVIGCAIGAVSDLTLNVWADWYTGRKITAGNALGYAVEGCGSGVVGAAVGEFIIAPVFEAAAPYVARLFTTEMEAAESAAAGEAAEGANPFTILNPAFIPDARAVLQNIVDAKSAALTANPALAQTVLSPAEIAASSNPAIAPMSWGNAIEGLVGNEVSQNFGSLINYTGRGAGPDFVGLGSAAGDYLELTTPGGIASHFARPYGPWLDFVTYIRPSGFIGF